MQHTIQKAQNTQLRPGNPGNSTSWNKMLHMHLTLQIYTDAVLPRLFSTRARKSAMYNTPGMASGNRGTLTEDLLAMTQLKEVGNSVCMIY